MPPQQTASEFEKLFCERTRAAREATGMSMTEMARKMGIGAEAYRSYETLRPMRHFLIERFAGLAQIDIESLYTGRGIPSRRRQAVTKGRAKKRRPALVD